MTEKEFEAKLARWKQRKPKPFVPATGFGRVARKHIPREQYMAHIEAVTRGRFQHRQSEAKAMGRRDEQ